MEKTTFEFRFRGVELAAVQLGQMDESRGMQSPRGSNHSGGTASDAWWAPVAFGAVVIYKEIIAGG